MSLRRERKEKWEKVGTENRFESAPEENKERRAEKSDRMKEWRIPKPGRIHRKCVEVNEDIYHWRVERRENVENSLCSIAAC